MYGRKKKNSANLIETCNFACNLEHFASSSHHEDESIAAIEGYRRLKFGSQYAQRARRSASSS